MKEGRQANTEGVKDGRKAERKNKARKEGTKKGRYSDTVSDVLCGISRCKGIVVLSVTCYLEYKGVTVYI